MLSIIAWDIGTPVPGDDLGAVVDLVDPQEVVKGTLFILAVGVAAYQARRQSADDK